ncbi:MAG: hypothetical protein LBC92_00400 [Rickettsiales bacterium]|jgi:hypothetical protein|nr:hypothetical protein [Rickettsiales bacterium]
MDNNNEERLKLESILCDMCAHMTELQHGNREREFDELRGEYGKNENHYDTVLIDSYLKKYSGDKWKDNKDESVKAMAGVIMYTYGGFFKKIEKYEGLSKLTEELNEKIEELNKEREEGKNKILEKIQNSNLSKEFLQEISRTLNLLKSGIDNKKFSIVGNILFYDSYTKNAYASTTSNELNQSIKFIEKINDKIKLQNVENKINPSSKTTTRTVAPSTATSNSNSFVNSVIKKQSGTSNSKDLSLSKLLNS